MSDLNFDFGLLTLKDTMNGSSNIVVFIFQVSIARKRTLFANAVEKDLHAVKN